MHDIRVTILGEPVLTVELDEEEEEKPYFVKAPDDGSFTPPRQYTVAAEIESIDELGTVRIALREPVVTRSINVTDEELKLTYI